MSVPNPNQNASAVDDNGQKSIIFKDSLGNPVAVSPENPLPTTSAWWAESGSAVSTGNSTEVELTIGQTFTGAWEDVLQYSEVIVSVHATENSAVDGLVIQWSSNGTEVHGTDEFTITQNSGKTFSFPCQNRYVRVLYTNNGATQSSFDLQVLLKKYASKGSSHRLKDNLNMEDDAIVTKSMIAGFSTAWGGAIVNVKVNPSGSLQVGGEIAITNIAWNKVNPATEEKQDVLIALNEMTTYLKWVLSSLQMPRNADPSNNADQVSVINTITANVSAITTLTNLQQFNGEQAHLMSVASEINAWANMQRSTIS